MAKIILIYEENNTLPILGFCYLFSKLLLDFIKTENIVMFIKQANHLFLWLLESLFKFREEMVKPK